ncbi:PASTA domain-containing protein [Halpernia sp.]|uniref:PASTA domain-containing protein n=1 Tax=Halpernia sp. TaxID=2782209 RepID=UPI003A9434B7
MLKSLFHWKVLVNLLLAMLIFTGLVWLTFRWLEFHTNHGKEIVIPSLVNKSTQDGIKILDETGLEYEVDSAEFNPKYKPFQILKMFPAAGSHVKDGRIVTLLVNPRSWAPVTVPDIIDKYKNTAFRNLEAVGLKVGDTIYEPSIQTDAVLRMQLNGSILKPGTLLPKFSVIDLVIGAGPKRNISIPNLVGLTVQEAKAIIAQNLFEVGLVEHEDGGRDESDIVYYQDPESNSVRDQGMQIDLWASKKTPAELGSKISQLNSMYRIRIDTTSTRIKDYVPPVYDEPVKIPNESKPEVKPKPEQDSKPKVEKTTTTAAPKVTPKPTPVKPKAKKVVVE